MSFQNYFAIAALLPSLALALAIIGGCLMYFAGAALRGSRDVVKSLASMARSRTRDLARSFQPAPTMGALRPSHAMIGRIER